MTLSSRAAARLLPRIILALAALHGVYLVVWLGFGHDNVFGFLPRLSLDRERSLATWYSAAALLAAGLLLAAIASRKRALDHPFVRHWRGLAAVFTYLAIDESIMLHEHFIGVGDALIPTLATGFLHWSWVLVGMAAVAVFAVAYLRFFLALPACFQRLFALSAILLVGGAIGVEMLNASRFELAGAADLRYQLGTMLEETLEMGGVALWLYALLAYIEAYLPGLTVQVGAPAGDGDHDRASATRQGSTGPSPIGISRAASVT